MNHVTSKETSEACATICRIVRNSCFCTSSEDEMQAALAKAMTGGGISFEREKRLSVSGRVDFMVGRLAIEVKTSGTRMQVMRQLQRYAEVEAVEAVLLITTKVAHTCIPDTLCGKPIYVVRAGSV